MKVLILAFIFTLTSINNCFAWPVLEKIPNPGSISILNIDWEKVAKEYRERSKESQKSQEPQIELSPGAFVEIMATDFGLAEEIARFLSKGKFDEKAFRHDFFPFIRSNALKGGDGDDLKGNVLLEYSQDPFRGLFNVVMGEFQRVVRVGRRDEFFEANLDLIRELANPRLELSTSEQRKLYASILGYYWLKPTKRFRYDTTLKLSNIPPEIAEIVDSFGDVVKQKRSESKFFAEDILALYKNPENEKILYWASDEAWTKVQNLILSDGIDFVRGGVNDGTIRKVNQLLESKGVAVSVIDMSADTSSTDFNYFQENFFGFTMWVSNKKVAEKFSFLNQLILSGKHVYLFQDNYVDCKGSTAPCETFPYRDHSSQFDRSLGKVPLDRDL